MTNDKYATELAEFQKLIGSDLPGGQNHEPVERGDIRRWAYFGVEDFSRRWNDVEVARSLGSEDLIAPPSFFYANDYTTSQMLVGKVENALPIYAKATWVFGRPCSVGDCLHVDRTLVDVNERVGRFAGPMVETVAETRYSALHDSEVLASCTSTIMRCRIDESSKRGKHNEDTHRPYSDEQLFHIQGLKESYSADPLAHPDLDAVREGDRLQTLVKGPHTARSLLRHRYGFRTYAGWTWDQTLRNSGDQGAEFFRALGYPEEFADMPSKWHEDPSYGKAMGFPRGGDFGPQRVSWFIQAVGDFIGLTADLEEITAKLILPNPVGDTSFIDGSVVEVDTQNDTKRLRLSLFMRNQSDAVTATADARVRLRSESQA